ncbi:GNAT family N-acetyltransferase [Qingshengfaniella alkalisoli]|uniref:GNAT family N-acetyltransferase n=1 Tax=Qingshengfaniella alkalisoli TaxID=2599296 RepID=A0A5B8I686_9RHOB|nr:GNAT family N-acetyltransferase [Qingshengfaniella alkalisoli]QDY68945.1 GNAT family N-acetyltransferase [Qingshengfaniella alkalisoli]
MKIETIVNQPTIEGERFTLRPLRRSDEGLLDMYTGDERVAKNTRSIPHPLPPGTSAAFVDRSQKEDRTEDVWVLDGSAHGLAELLGVVSLERMENDRSEIGYWVAPAFWNTGFASEAVRTLIGANPHNSKTIFAEVFQSNPVSARVLTNIGFEYIGDAEAYSVAQERTVPTWTYLKKIG